MKAGKIASLGLIGGLTLASVVVLAVLQAAPFISEWLNSLFGPVRVAVMMACMVPAFALVLIPFGMAMDRALTDAQRFIEDAGSSEQTNTYHAPKWLDPITRAFIHAANQGQQRESSLRNQLRDLEVRHRVSESERRQIEAVLHALRDAVLVTDPFNEIVMANDTAATLMGFDLEDVIHKPIDDVVRDERLVRMITDAKEAANVAERLHAEHELPVGQDEHGRPTDTCLFDVTLACVENHKHEVGGVVTVLHDLTRERAVSEMKTDFVSKASHELRTPLSSIRAYVEMLVDGEAEDENSRQEFYGIIQNEAERLGRLIDNMLNISRIEAGIVQIEREEVDVKPLIKRAADALGPQTQEKNITLNTRLAPVDLRIEGDGDMLYQAILNLASNAVKYTPEGGRVTISADSDNLTRSVVLSVSDTGLGIPPDALPKLFEKFFRVENYKRVAKGTGLGLSLCKHIVETVHHGQIGVESQLGMGSKFWFSVPMRYVGSHAAA